MDSSVSVVKKEYFGELDILRFLAFLCVFVSHVFVFSSFRFESEFLNTVTTYLFTQGNLGVTFFFVLSGFLITYLLFKEKEKNGDISIKKFYVRRILRIWPVYLAVIFVGFVLIPLVLEVFAYYQFLPSSLITYTAGTEPYRIPWYILFVANFDTIVNGSSAFFLAILWSVSVEEQFYLIWPAIIKKLSIIKVTNLFFLLILFSFIFRYVYIDDLITLRSSTFSFLSDLSTGAFLAYIIFYKKNVKEKIQKIPSWFTSVLILTIPLFFVLYKHIEIQSFANPSVLNHVLYALMPQILAIFFAMVIAFFCVTGNSFFKGPLHDKLVWLGKISYGLYCYHCFGILFSKMIFLIPIFATFRNSLIGFLVGALVAFLSTVLFSELSYRFMEKPILRIKEKFQS